MYGCCGTCHRAFGYQTFQGTVPAHSSPTGGGGMGTYSGNAGWGINPPVSMPMVQRGGLGA